MALPEGTVTLLFAYIEGSTKLWEAHPEAMRIALARHDALLREAIEAHDGYIFKTIGDAFCAAFATAPDALRATLAAQQTLAHEAWPEGIAIKVRMALHTGTVESRDSDYFGQPLNRVARLLSTGHGGQTLLSLAATELTRDSLPQGATLRSLGEHRLKDLGRPESVFQLCHPSLPSDFAPLRSLANPELRHNLPQQVTSFVGREKQIAEVKVLLEKTKLLTLTGSGGCGKTRLALQVAAELLDGEGEGVWLVEMAPLADPGLVPQTVASALGLKEEPGKSLTQSLVNHLKSKNLLLVLDNCEHLLDACAKLADTLIRQCPGVQLLATSREGLGIAGETTYRVPSLSLPDPRQSQTPASLSHYESVRLFIDRALQVQTTFAVTNTNAPALASLCLRLDGIPLAIELAAARVRSLSVEDINSKLDQRFRLLTGGSRTSLPRQQTLRSLIDWSYDLLNAVEKALLCRLSVFAGGWTLESAEQVCSGEPVADGEVLDLLTSLCDKSLVLAEPLGSSTRYRLLETVRQYARDRLLESGEEETWRDRHLVHFLALAEEAEPKLTGPEQAEWLGQLDAEHENVRASLDWSLKEADSEAVLRLCGAMSQFWWTRGYLSEGREWGLQALCKPGAGERTRERANTLYGVGVMASHQCDYPVAKAYLEESLGIRQEVGDKTGIAGSLNDMGLLATFQGDYSSAQAYLEESLEINRKIGDKRGIARSLNNLGYVAKFQADYSKALSYLEESLGIAQEIGNKVGIAASFNNLGEVACYQGDYVAARDYLEQSLVICLEVGDRISIAGLLETFGVLAGKVGRVVVAATLWGAAEALREEIGAPLPFSDRERHEKQVSAARAALNDDEAFERAWVKGRALTLEQAVALALASSPDSHD